MQKRVTISIDYELVRLADLRQKQLGFRDRSHLYSACLNKFLKNPIEIIKDKVRYHNNQMLHYAKILEDMTEVSKADDQQSLEEPIVVYEAEDQRAMRAIGTERPE